MTEVSETRQNPWRGATLALRVGLALSLASAVGLFIDQTSAHSLAEHVSAQYSPYGAVPDPNVLFGYLYATAGLAIAAWLIALRGVRSRKSWVRLFASVTFLVGAMLAVFNLVIREYGTPIFPVLWSVLGLLPALAGLVAVRLLWTRASRRPGPALELTSP